MSVPNLRFIFMVLAALCFLAAALGASLTLRKTNVSFGWLGIFFAYLVYAFM